MNVSGMSDLLRDINQLEKEVVTIALADHEKYEYFSNRILDLKQELFDLDEENGALDAQEIIKKVQDLRFEFNQYLQTGEQDKDKIELVFSQNKEKISGKENRKRYRINLYKSILEDLKKTSNVDLERLETLRTKWKEEKEGKWGYSPVEIDVVEEEFAEIFFNYQIKSLQKNGMMQKESFTEFCEQEKYEKKVKEKLLEKIQSLEPGTRKRLDLEQLFTSGNIEDIVNSKNFWSVISGVDVKEDINLDFNPPAKSVTEKPILQETTAIVPLYNASKRKVLTLMKFNFFGRTIQIQKKFRILENGVSAIPEIFKKRIFAIAFPEGTTKIESVGLWQLKNLEQVYLPESLEEIGRKAFSDCHRLKEIRIPTNVKRIGELAFDFCDNLEKVDLKNCQISAIEDYSFKQCQNLQKVEIPDTVERIGKRAFYASGLREIHFPKKLKSIEALAFMQTDIEDLKLPNSVERVEEKAFSDCQKLRKVSLSDNIDEIPAAAFRHCQKLEDISLPQKLIKIGTEAFFGCRRLKKIHLPEKVREIDDFAFGECLELQEVEIEKEKENIKMRNEAFPFGVKFKKVSTQQGDDDDDPKRKNSIIGRNISQEETSKDSDDYYIE